MSAADDEGLPELALALARAIGLMDADGNLQPGWFGAPLEAIFGLLTAPEQRDALADALQAVAPAEAIAGVAADEAWHPLVRVARGAVYLTWRRDGEAVIIGAGARFGGVGGPPDAELRAHLPIVRADATSRSVDAVAGTAGSPLVVETRLGLGWAAPAQDFSLAAVRITAAIAPRAADGAKAALAAVLEGLDLDGSGARDVTLAGDALAAEAAEVLLALLRHRLGALGGAAAHLLPLFGLGGAAGGGIPPLPIAELTRDARALSRWLAALVDDGAGPPPVVAWLGHLAALFGSHEAAALDPDEARAWRVRLVSLGDGDSGLYLSLGRRPAADGSTTLAAFGVAVVVAPATHPAARIAAGATIGVVPLAGPRAARARSPMRPSC
jgi:hypothetical protein